MKIKTMVVITILILIVAAPALAAEREIRSGKVLMGHHAGKYTFILLEENGEQHWLAANFIDIAPGDIVEYAGGIEMRDFHSPAMNHTFAEILLVTNIRIAQMVDLPGDGEPETPQAATRPAAPPEQEVKRLSIAELFLNRHDLEGKIVSLQAKVVSYSGNIMGKNWLTLGDGTGVAPDNTVLAISQENARLGETLTVVGRVQIDVKVGGMHSYKLLLDDAQLFQ
ncbi:hypothetical protein ACHHRT_03120 [Desulfurivibrio sp. D14AmB]|uniref:hypothetical protein n=1 Tax=Desulfurivibrio sp. D14AmB TaxID=3374370 RepID=UPI00376F2624